MSPLPIDEKLVEDAVEALDLGTPGDCWGKHCGVSYMFGHPDDPERQVERLTEALNTWLARHGLRVTSGEGHP